MTDRFQPVLAPSGQPVVRNDVMSGAPGFQLSSGRLYQDESSNELRGRRKYLTYSNMISSVPIVAAAVRLHLNLMATVEWNFSPSAADTEGEFADMARLAILDSPLTPFPRIVRRSGMGMFYGFSIQEWQMRMAPEGFWVFHDIAPRPQITIDRWDAENDGKIRHAIQRDPQTSRDIFLPREKLVYITDDAIADNPEGHGIFRDIVAPARRYMKYAQLEGQGFEGDLRGIPVARAPLSDLETARKNKLISQADYTKALGNIRGFAKNPIREAGSGILLDSKSYERTDNSGAPSTIRQWDLELLRGGATALSPVNTAMGRTEAEIARGMAAELLLLGAQTAGSFALSQDKSDNLYLMIDSNVDEIRDSYKRDLLDRLWEVNAWPEEMKPEMRTQSVRPRDVKLAAEVLELVANASLDPTDPVINEMRRDLGYSDAVVGTRPPPTTNPMANAVQTVTDGDFQPTEGGGA